MREDDKRDSREDRRDSRAIDQTRESIAIKTALYLHLQMHLYNMSAQISETSL